MRRGVRAQRDGELVLEGCVMRRASSCVMNGRSLRRARLSRMRAAGAGMPSARPASATAQALLGDEQQQLALGVGELAQAALERLGEPLGVDHALDAARPRRA